MSASDRLRAMAGGNMAQSISRQPSGKVAPNLAAAPADRHSGLNRIKGAFQLPTDRVMPDPDQPRKEFDPASLDRLATSLKNRGQLQPIRVRWEESVDYWIIVAGERRWRAAQIAGLTTIAAVEAAGLDPDEVLEDQLVENCLREDLRPIEQAHAYQMLIERRGLSQRQLAERLQISQATIAQSLALLALPLPIQESVETGRLAPTTAYELSKVDDPEQQRAIADRITTDGLTRAEASQVIRTTTGKPAGGKGKSKGRGVPRITSRILRTTVGKVTVELKRGQEGHEAIRAALVEALRLIDGADATAA